MAAPDSPHSPRWSARSGGVAAGAAGGQRVRLEALARRLGLRAGEVAELLERLPFGECEGGQLPEVWRRPAARRAIEAYAARKRAVARLARRGGLGDSQ